ncbi:glucokinase [Burkholderiaceae bacterium DAT-1]|nr:glucokinase [Burkholderiaceae bacterium DAT-1]
MRIDAMDTLHTLYPRLIGDVGGTNVRLALILEDGASISHEQVLPADDFAGLEEAIRFYCEQHQVKPTAAGIGIATAISGDQVSMTNRDWSFSISEMKSSLGLAVLVVINDFTALANSLPYLPIETLEQVGGGKLDWKQPVALLGPGTGLGVSGLFPYADHQGLLRFQAIRGEGGHVTLPATNEEEDDVIRVLRARFGHVSAERILSGSGLLNLHEALATVRKQPIDATTPADITHIGLSQPSSLASQTLDMFCGMLGTVAGNLVLTLGALGGVFIGGGIVPRLGDRFARSPFRERFEDKGRLGQYLNPVPAMLIRAHNPALLGAAAALDDYLIQLHAT